MGKQFQAQANMRFTIAIAVLSGRSQLHCQLFHQLNSSQFSEWYGANTNLMFHGLYHSNNHKYSLGNLYAIKIQFWQQRLRSSANTHTHTNSLTRTHKMLGQYKIELHCIALHWVELHVMCKRIDCFCFGCYCCCCCCRQREHLSQQKTLHRFPCALCTYTTIASETESDNKSCGCTISLWTCARVLTVTHFYFPCFALWPLLKCDRNAMITILR